MPVSQTERLDPMDIDFTLEAEAALRVASPRLQARREGYRKIDIAEKGRRVASLQTIRELGEARADVELQYSVNEKERIRYGIKDDDGWREPYESKIAELKSQTQQEHLKPFREAICPKLDAFIGLNHRAAFEDADLPELPKDFYATRDIPKAETAVAAKASQLETIWERPRTYEEAADVIHREFDLMAARGQPDLAPVFHGCSYTHSGQRTVRNPRAHIEWPETFAGLFDASNEPVLVPDPALLIWAFKDQLLAKVLELAKSKTRRDAMKELDKPKAIRAAEAELLEARRYLEECYIAAEQSGMTVQRKGPIIPEICLGILPLRQTPIN